MTQTKRAFLSGILGVSLIDRTNPAIADTASKWTGIDANPDLTKLKNLDGQPLQTGWNIVGNSGVEISSAYYDGMKARGVAVNDYTPLPVSLTASISGSTATS